MVIPPKLQKGDTIALISPSSPLPPQEPVEEIAAAVQRLGFSTWIGESCRGSSACGYAAASPEVRAADIHRAFSDDSIRAVWCTRGGSTAWQLLPLLDYELIAAHPKPFIGFSDITTLHLAMQQRCGMVSYHGPTANRVLRWGEQDDFSWPSLWAALQMEGTMVVSNPPGEAIQSLRPGQAAGRLIGGNLALVAASVGTPWQIDARDGILYLEDVGEAVYSLERMLAKLRYAGILDSAAGIVLGAFTSCRNAYRPEYGPGELVRDFFREHGGPVLYNVRSAHCAPMCTLPMGMYCHIDGNRATMTMEF